MRNLLLLVLMLGGAQFCAAQSAANTQLSREEMSKTTPSISLPAPAVSANTTVVESTPAANLSREERSAIVPHISLPAPAEGTVNTAPAVVQQGSREERSKQVVHITLPAPNN